MYNSSFEDPDIHEKWDNPVERYAGTTEGDTWLDRFRLHPAKCPPPLSDVWFTTVALFLSSANSSHTAAWGMSYAGFHPRKHLFLLQIPASPVIVPGRSLLPACSAPKCRCADIPYRYHEFHIPSDTERPDSGPGAALPVKSPHPLRIPEPNPF